jgi:hypothetical protein
MPRGPEVGLLRRRELEAARDVVVDVLRDLLGERWNLIDAEVLAAMLFDGWAWNDGKFEKGGRRPLSMQEARQRLTERRNSERSDE